MDYRAISIVTIVCLGLALWTGAIVVGINVGHAASLVLGLS